MSRGYFADMSDLKKHGGKIAAANKVLIPAAVAVKFPGFEVSYADGKTVKLPVVMDGSEAPKATLLCLSFRASSQVSRCVCCSNYHSCQCHISSFSPSSNMIHSPTPTNLKCKPKVLVDSVLDQSYHSSSGTSCNRGNMVWGGSGKRHHASPEKASTPPKKRVQNLSSTVPLATLTTRSDLRVCNQEQNRYIKQSKHSLKQKSVLARTTSTSKSSPKLQNFKELFIPSHTKSRCGTAQGMDGSAEKEEFVYRISTVEEWGRNCREMDVYLVETSTSLLVVFTLANSIRYNLHCRDFS